MKTLYIANKNYSSWSLRPWILMKELSLEFEEVIAPFNTGKYWQEFRKFSPNGMVPCLLDKQQTVWDSFAIMEYLAETETKVWPRDKRARTWARCASAEMHSGFSALRQQCAMNCGLRIKLNSITPELQHDIDRIDELWTQGLQEFTGPFLAGESFTAVDAFFAPVVFRAQTFALPFSPQAKKYMKRILTLPSMQEWYQAALKEKWRESDHEQEAKDSGTILYDYRI